MSILTYSLSSLPKMDNMDSYMNDHFASALGPEQNSFSYTEGYSSSPDPLDGVQQPYANRNQMDYQYGNHVSDQFAAQLGGLPEFPRSSHDELNQFFTDSIFGTPPAPEPRQPNSMFTAPGHNLQSHQSSSYGGVFEDLTVQNYGTPSVDPWTLQSESPLGIITSGLPDQELSGTMVKHGQITPGNSPASPKSGKPSEIKVQSAGRTTNTTSVIEEAQKPVKRTRKPRKSSKKPPTKEQEEAKRETFLKRNREAAHKCRIKKKTQNVQIQDRVKLLKDENALKGLEVEELKSEIVTLKGLLLPHYRDCNDEKLVKYMDESSMRSPDWMKKNLQDRLAARQLISEESSTIELPSEADETLLAMRRHSDLSTLESASLLMKRRVSCHSVDAEVDITRSKRGSGLSLSISLNNVIPESE